MSDDFRQAWEETVAIVRQQSAYIKVLEDALQKVLPCLDDTGFLPQAKWVRDILNRTVPVLVALLLTAQVALPVPDEATLNRALRIGYVLNGEQMVRELSLGSIDVSGLLFVVDSSLITPPKPLAKGAE